MGKKCFFTKVAALGTTAEVFFFQKKKTLSPTPLTLRSPHVRLVLVASDRGETVVVAVFSFFFFRFFFLLFFFIFFFSFFFWLFFVEAVGGAGWSSASHDSSGGFASAVERFFCFLLFGCGALYVREV